MGDTRVTMQRVLQLCVFLCSSLPLWALPDGAPVEACGDLLPAHGLPPQSSPAPFKVEVERHGDHADVTIERTSGKEFRGFAIQGKDASGQITGRFEILDAAESRILSCPGGDDAENTVTHTNNNLKSSITVEYYPPAGSDISEITMTASVVVDLLEFWVGLETTY